MSQPPYAPATTLLDYYREHGISPVRYEMGDLNAHLDRRDFLYRTLGLPPTAFKGCAVLEVAAGSGQNSLYVASRMPAVYDLVEPNPVGLRDIQAAYAGFPLPHTSPRLMAEQFESFTPDRAYDIVICENWLGGAANETALLGKLASHLAPGGVLVATFVPYSGFAPNVARHALAQRLLDQQRGEMSYEAQTEFLVGVFGRHLSTMPAMTRSHQDWVKDSMLNTAWLPVALPLGRVIESIGPEMEALAFSPSFDVDWRWFKTGAGEGRRLNEIAQENYLANLHNFLDWRTTRPARPAEDNLELDGKFQELHAAVTGWVSTRDAEGRGQIERALGAIVQGLSRLDPDLSEAFGEALALWRKPEIVAEELRDLPKFGPLFGREAVYGSFTRRR